jgi:hypothetical protein
LRKALRFLQIFFGIPTGLMLGYVLTPIVQGDPIDGPRPIVIDIVEGVGVGMPGISALEQPSRDLTPNDSPGPAETMVIDIEESVGVSQGIGSSRLATLEFQYGVVVTDDIQIVTTAPLCAGDLNGDSRVNVVDVVLGLQIVVGVLPMTESHTLVGDLNADGRFDILDAIKGMKNLVGGSATQSGCISMT